MRAWLLLGLLVAFLVGVAVATTSHDADKAESASNQKCKPAWKCPTTTTTSTTTPAPTSTTTTTPAPTTTTTPNPDPAITYSFQDEFNGTALDTTKWTSQNTTLEGVTMKSENVFLDGAGHLAIRNKRDPNSNTGFSGGFVATYNWSYWPPPNVKASVSVPFEIEARMIYPAVGGGWSGMWPENVDTAPPILEFDIGEQRSSAPLEAGCHQHYAPIYHWNGSVAGGVTNITQNWHTYSAKVWRDRVEYYVDGRPCLSSSGAAPGPVPTRFGIQFDTKIGKPGTWGSAGGQPAAGDPGPWDFKIDYVRVKPL